MPRRQREARVAFARIDFKEGYQAPLPGADEALLKSMVPGTTVERYNRLWHMARWEQEGRLVTGKIGFETPGATGMWDAELKDFKRITPAQIAPFGVDLDEMRVAFQLRSRLIKPGTFRGAFEALLNKARPYLHWVVRLEGVEQPPWEEWRERVERITKLRISMRRPNPRYPGDEIEHLFEDANFAAATLAGKGENIDTEADLIRQAIALAQDYGSIQATGVVVDEATATVREEEWSSAKSEMGVKRVEAPVDPETGEVPPPILRETLRERAEGD